MANTPTETSSASSHSQSGSRNSRVARRTNGSPRANPYPAHDTHTNRARRLVDARRWNWLPDKLTTWRNEEGIKLPNETGESSNMEISPYTREPAHFTVPVLAVRLNRHERQLRDMNLELQETRENWRLTALERIHQVSEDHENTVNNMDVLHDKVVEIGVEAALLRLRIEECEQRSREAEEYTRELVQRLVLAEDNARQASRLANTVDRLVTLMEQINLHQD